MSKILEVKNLTFGYKGQVVLNDISYVFHRGKFYGILGPNGSGKSTFLELLLGILTPTSGDIFFDGKRICEFNKKELAKKIAYVPQVFTINFPYTAHEIIMMGRYPYIGKFSLPDEKDIKIVEHIEKQLDLSKLKTREMNKLSGGERQRVMIARAIAQDSLITLLDEPTSNLDISHSLKILRLLKRKVRKEKKTIICVFHNINEAVYFCDELIFFKNKKIKASGEVSNVLTEKVIKEVFDVSSKVYFEERLKCHQVIFYPDETDIVYV